MVAGKKVKTQQKSYHYSNHSCFNYMKMEGRHRKIICEDHVVGSYPNLFFGFFWARELFMPGGTEFDSSEHMAIDDVGVDDKVNPSMVQLTLKKSKTA